MENWIWGLSLIALTIAIHGTAVVWIASAETSIRAGIESKSSVKWRHLLEFNVGLIGVVGLLLAALHGIEAALWAAAYWWLGAFNSPTDAIFHSVDSMSTLGDSGLTLEPHWRMMGWRDGRYAAVRHQYSLHLRGDAGLLVTHDPRPPSLS